MQYNRAINLAEQQQHQQRVFNHPSLVHHTRADDREPLSDLISTNVPRVCRSDKRSENFFASPDTLFDSAKQHDSRRTFASGISMPPQGAEKYGILQSVTSVPLFGTTQQAKPTHSGMGDASHEMTLAVQQLQLPPPSRSACSNPAATLPVGQPALCATSYTAPELWTSGVVPGNDSRRNIVEYGNEVNSCHVAGDLHKCTTTDASIIDEVCTSSQVVHHFLSTKSAHSGQEEKEYVLQLMKQAQVYCEASMRADAHLTEAEAYFHDLTALEESLMSLLNEQQQSGIENDETSGCGSLANSLRPSRRESMLLPPPQQIDKAFASHTSSANSTPKISAVQPNMLITQNMRDGNSGPTNSLASANLQQCQQQQPPQQMCYAGENTCAHPAGRRMHSVNTNENNGSHTLVGNQRVITDIQMCQRLIKRLEELEPYMRDMELTHARLQQYFLLHDCKEYSHAANQGIAHNSTSSSSDINHIFDDSNKTDKTVNHDDKENKLRVINATNAVPSHSATIKARQEAVRERLMDELLLQRREQAAAASHQRQQRVFSETDSKHHSTENTHIRPARDDKRENESADTTSTLLIVSVPTITMSAEFVLGSHQIDTKFTTVIASPSRYAQVQLHLMLRLKIESMMARLKSLHTRRQCEIQTTEQKISTLDVYDPSITDILTRRDTCTQELHSLQSWLHQLYQLQLRSHNAQLEMDSSLINAARLRRQILEVLEQRLYEEEVRRSSLAFEHRTSSISRDSISTEDVNNDGSVEFSNIDMRSSVLNDRAKQVNDMLQSIKQLPRASTVFRAMLEQIAEQHKHRQQWQDDVTTDETNTTTRTLVLYTPGQASIANKLEKPQPPQSVVEEIDDKTTDTGSLITAQEQREVSVSNDASNSSNALQNPCGQVNRQKDEDEQRSGLLVEKRQRVEIRTCSRVIPVTETVNPRRAEVVSISAAAIDMDKSNRNDADKMTIERTTSGDDNKTHIECEPQEYSLRHGQLLHGFKALLTSVIKRAITFSDDEACDSDDASTPDTTRTTSDNTKTEEGANRQIDYCRKRTRE